MNLSQNKASSPLFWKNNNANLMIYWKRRAWETEYILPFLIQKHIITIFQICMQKGIQSGASRSKVRLLYCWIVCEYFHSFEAGIANAISSFKWMKNILIMKNSDLPNWLTEHLSQDMLQISVVFYLVWNCLSYIPYIYTVLEKCTHIVDDLCVDFFVNLGQLQESGSCKQIIDCFIKLVNISWEL